MLDAITPRHLSLAELEAALPAVLTSPKDDGTLELIVRRPACGTWWLLLLTVFGAVGFAPTSIYLVPSGLWAALLACGVLWPRRSTLRPALTAGAALLPLLGWGLYLAANLDPLVSDAIADRTTRGRWRDDFLFIHLNFAEGGGALVLLVGILARRRGFHLASPACRNRARLRAPISECALRRQWRPHALCACG